MIDSKFSWWLLLLFVTKAGFLFSQPENLWQHPDYQSLFEKELNRQEVYFHTAVKPWIKSDLNRWMDVDSATKNLPVFKGFLQKKDGPNFLITPFPVFQMMPAFEFSDTVSNSMAGTFIGGAVRGSIRNKFSFFGSYITANSGYPSYFSDYIKNNAVVPGQSYAFGTKAGYHYKNATGYLSYDAGAHFNFQLGHGKNFFGDGYRSLLLSDFANNYSYLKITTTIWRIKYINLFTNFKDITNISSDFLDFDNKYGTFHYLSWNATKWLNLSFFESVIWHGKDSISSRGFDINYLNPVIFFRPVEYSIGSTDNSLMGLTAKIKPMDKIQFYGQLILDEFLLSEIKAGNGWWGNKYGWQAGGKWFDAFGLNNVILQAEVNEVRPYTYAHVTSLTNYGHFNQPLAHPLGANFREAVGIVHYSLKGWSIRAKMNFIQTGKDTASVSYGGNIYRPYQERPSEYDHYIGQGVQQILLLNELRISKILFPQYFLVLEAGIVNRNNGINGQKYTDNFVFFGLRTAIDQNYLDF